LLAFVCVCATFSFNVPSFKRFHNHLPTDFGRVSSRYIRCTGSFEMIVPFKYEALANGPSYAGSLRRKKKKTSFPWFCYTKHRIQHKRYVINDHLHLPQIANSKQSQISLLEISLNDQSLTQAFSSFLCFKGQTKSETSFFYHFV
jgi:hypothetical protein